MPGRCPAKRPYGQNVIDLLRIMKLQKIDHARLASTDQEYLDLLASEADWIIRSNDDLLSLRSSGIEPFAKLSDIAFKEFVDSIMYSQGGLGHADYSSVMKELAITEIFELFAYFGLGSSQLLDPSCLRSMV